MKKAFHIFCTLLMALAAPALVSGQVHEATLRFEPAAPFVGQPFVMTLEVAVNPGVELENLFVEGLPDASRVRFVNLIRAGRETRRSDGGRVTDILRYTAEGQAIQPFQTAISCILRGQSVERVSHGFFSQTRSSPITFRTTAARLNVRAIPLRDRPADFSGAIGRFTLAGTASPQTVAVGDLVTLSYTLTGSGWLADAALTLPDPGPDFKTYPAQETTHEPKPPQIAIRQVVIPLSTNATVVQTPRFVYFDPNAVAYRTATIEPFRLTFVQADATVPAIRRIDATTPVRSTDSVPARPPERVIVETVAKIRQLYPLAAALILAAAVTAVLFRIRRIPAVLAGLLIVALGVGVSRRLSRAAEDRVMEVAASVTTRLAPSEHALPLFDLHPGDAVIPLEHAPGWVRVRSADREAWIPVTNLTN